MEPIWRLTVDRYHAMIETGILSSGSPVELVEGILLRKMSKKPPHSFATEEARVALFSVLPAGWCVRAQEPITLADSEPEPDIAVSRGSNRKLTSSSWSWRHRPNRRSLRLHHRPRSGHHQAAYVRTGRPSRVLDCRPPQSPHTSTHQSSRRGLSGSDRPLRRRRHSRHDRRLPSWNNSRVLPSPVAQSENASRFFGPAST